MLQKKSRISPEEFSIDSQCTEQDLDDIETLCGTQGNNIFSIEINKSYFGSFSDMCDWLEKIVSKPTNEVKGLSIVFFNEKDEVDVGLLKRVLVNEHGKVNTLNFQCCCFKPSDEWKDITKHYKVTCLEFNDCNVELSHVLTQESKELHCLVLEETAVSMEGNLALRKFVESNKLKSLKLMDAEMELKDVIECSGYLCDLEVSSNDLSDDHLSYYEDHPVFSLDTIHFESNKLTKKGLMMLCRGLKDKKDGCSIIFSGRDLTPKDQEEVKSLVDYKDVNLISIL